jgi:hypothetical protein
MPKEAKSNTVQCKVCNLEITEQRTKAEIRRKLKALGWTRMFIGVFNGRNVYDDRCGKCTDDAKRLRRQEQCKIDGECCHVTLTRDQMAQTPIEDLVSPWRIQ